MANTEPYILILYYSRHGAVEQMAKQIALGVQITGMNVLLRTVADISSNCEASAPQIPEHGDIYCTLTELENCSGLIVGSPSYFGNMASPLKYFIDNSSTLWMSGALIDKPAALFCSSSSLHGGQETTLMSMMIPLLHHGMVFTGIPYSATPLLNTTSGGTPYGATHVAGKDNTNELDANETSLCKTLGQRVANIAKKLL